MSGARPEQRNELSWSHSRGATFGECRRRYYYHYYGAWGGWDAHAAPEVRRLYLLKNLRGRYLWAGAVVHEAVADILRRMRAGLPLPAPETAAEAAVARMREEFRQSREGAYLADPRGAVGLVEHHYGEAVSDADWKALAETVRRSIRGFFAEPQLEGIRRLSKEDWLALEDLESFALDGTRVYVKMDLAYRHAPDGVTIVDWKTGRRRPQPEGLQLGVYARHAMSCWQLEPERIRVVEVNLTTGEAGGAAATREQVTAAEQTIRRDLEAMRAPLVDAENNVARVEDFPAAPDPRICARCSFREACPEFQALLAGQGAAGARQGR